MPDLPSELNRVLKYTHETVQNLLGQLASPEHQQTRWGGPDADHTFRGVLADAIDETDRPHAATESALLRDPNQHVVLHEGRVRPGRFTGRHFDTHLANFSNYMNEVLPNGYPNHWHVEYPDESDDRNVADPNPTRLGMVDEYGNDNYRYVHHPQHFGQHVANLLTHDIELALGNGHIDNDQATHAVRTLNRDLRNAPYEEVHADHLTEQQE